MERSRNKIRSPRMKASNVQYAPEGRRGNVYVDEDGRRIYRTSGKSGNSKRYVVMDDGELKRGERQEPSKVQNVVYQDETEYETVSEADSEYLVPVRPKGERNSTRRIERGRPPVITRTVSEERPRVLTKTVSEERPRVVTRRIIEEDIPKDSNVVLRSRPASGYVVGRDYDNTREAYVVRSSRPASAIVRSRPSSEIIRERPSSERIITKRIEDDTLNTREVYVRRERPSSEIIRERPSSSRIVARRIEDDTLDTREVYVRRERPSSEKRIVENREIVHIRRPRSEERVLRRQEYIDYPQEYMVHRPAKRDVGCQMTTHYVIQQPPKQRKLLRNVQTQTIKKQKERKIKTATHYYQRETVEVVQEPEPPTPRMPTPPPPPRIPTPEPPKRKSKKKKTKKENMQLVVKQPNYPEPVYDTVEDLEVVPGSSKIYYEEPKKVPSYQYPEPDPPKYAYYEPSEYSTKNIVPAKAAGPFTLNGKIPSKITLKVLDYFKTKDPDKFYVNLDITAESTTSGSSYNIQRVTRTDMFYTVPLKGSTTFYGPYTHPPNRKSKHKRKPTQKEIVYEHPRYVEIPTKDRRRQKPVPQSGKVTSGDSVPPVEVETYLKKVPRNPPVQIRDYVVEPRSSLKRPSDNKRKPRGPVQTEDYGTTLPRGPSFYMKESNPVLPKDEYEYNSNVMYINPKTDKREPLKYTVEKEPKINHKKRPKEEGEEARYVIVPGFGDKPKHTECTIVDNTDKPPDNGPLVIIEDPLNENKEKTSLTVQTNMEDTYLEPISHGSLPDKALPDKAVKQDPDECPIKMKNKAHMVRVGGGWMKVEHHRNHHTPLKIYEIPRDANDDKFLYIKSRFNTSKKDVPVAYKKYREEIVRG